MKPVSVPIYKISRQDFHMILALFYIFNFITLILAKATTTSTSSASISVSSISVNSGKVAKPEPTKTSTSVSSVSKSAAPIVSSSTICVECYKKLKTKDCSPCKCECTDGTKYTFTNSEGAQCPKNPQDVPCQCKDQYGRIKPDASYINHELNITNVAVGN